MGRHARVSPLASAAMRVILAAPADAPADTDQIIAALGRRPFRVITVLARLELSGWVTSEWTGGHRVYLPAYAAHWYEARIAPPARKGKTDHDG